jgi:hypothetical protein
MEVRVFVRFARSLAAMLAAGAVAISLLGSAALLVALIVYLLSLLVR